MREQDFEYVTATGEVIPTVWMGEDTDIIIAYGHVTHEDIVEWARMMLHDIDLMLDTEEVEESLDKASSSHHWGIIREVLGEERLDLRGSEDDVDALPLTRLELW